MAGTHRRPGLASAAWWPAWIAARALLALAVRTAFDPDEFWQALEPARVLVGERGHLTWEWQPGIRLRGWAHPALFAAFYAALRAVGLDSRWAVAYGPRMLQGALAGLGDWAVFRLGARTLGPRGARVSLLVQAGSWFYAYAAVRPFSNSLECVLSALALAFWPLGAGQVGPGAPRRDRRIALGFAAAAVIARPSAAIFWLFLGGAHLASCRPFLQAGLRDLCIGDVLPIGLASLALMVAIDWLGYGEFTFVPFNFVRLNLLEGVSSEYGTHRWWWYFGECFPTVLSGWLPLFLVGAARSLRGGGAIRAARRPVATLAAFVCWGLAVMSLSAHKELRFALPLLPAAHVVAAAGYLALEQRYSKLCRRFMVLVLAAHAVVGAFLAGFHQRAPAPLMDWLADPATNATFVDFYTRCHATPFFSHVHGTGVRRMRFLDCSPAVQALLNVPGMGHSARDGIEEEDRFFDDPVEFWTSRFAREDDKPSHMVITTEKVNDSAVAWAAQSLGMELCATFPHTFDDAFLVLCRAPAA